jgi:hypothetical protein
MAQVHLQTALSIVTRKKSLSCSKRSFRKYRPMRNRKRAAMHPEPPIGELRPPHVTSSRTDTFCRGIKSSALAQTRLHRTVHLSASTGSRSNCSESKLSLSESLTCLMSNIARGVGVRPDSLQRVCKRSDRMFLRMREHPLRRTIHPNH